MEYRPLEITLISADGIKDVSTFGKMDVYAVAYISGDPQSKKKTKVDKNCGTSPRWNQKLEFTIDERLLSNPGTNLVIQLKDDRFGPDKDIGEVAVPIAELLNNGQKDTDAAERQVDYQIRTSSGKPKGTLKFSYKFGEKKSYNYSEKTIKAEEPVTAYPPPGYQAGGSYPGAAYPPGVAYQQPHPGYGYPPPPGPQGYYGGYPPAAQGGYPPHPGYGYAPPPPAPGYGYQQPPVQQGKKKKSGALGMGLGLGAGLLGGMILGDMVSDVGEMAAYSEGYEDAMDAASGFDF